MRTTMSLIIALALAGTAAFQTAQAAGQNSGSPAAKPGNLAAPKPKPKKGIIYIKGKRFTSCSDWGKDKGWCSKNM